MAGFDKMIGDSLSSRIVSVNQMLNLYVTTLICRHPNYIRSPIGIIFSAIRRFIGANILCYGTPLPMDNLTCKQGAILFELHYYWEFLRSEFKIEKKMLTNSVKMV